MLYSWLFKKAHSFLFGKGVVTCHFGLRVVGSSGVVGTASPATNGDEYPYKAIVFLYERALHITL